MADISYFNVSCFVGDGLKFAFIPICIRSVITFCLKELKDNRGWDVVDFNCLIVKQKLTLNSEGIGFRVCHDERKLAGRGLKIGSVIFKGIEILVEYSIFLNQLSETSLLIKIYNISIMFLVLFQCCDWN